MLVGGVGGMGMEMEMERWGMGDGGRDGRCGFLRLGGGWLETLRIFGAEVLVGRDLAIRVGGQEWRFYIVCNIDV